MPVMDGYQVARAIHGSGKKDAAERMDTIQKFCAGKKMCQ